MYVAVLPFPRLVVWIESERKMESRIEEDHCSGFCTFWTDFTVDKPVHRDLMGFGSYRPFLLLFVIEVGVVDLWRMTG